MLQVRHQQQVQALGERQHGHGNLHGRADVQAGVVAGGQHLHGHQAHQARAVAGQRQRHALHVARAELAVVKERGNQRRAKNQQRRRARQAQQHHQAQAPVQHGRVGRLVAAGARSRELRGEYHAQRHAQQGGGKFHQPVGIPHPGDAAFGQVRGNLRVNQQRKLRHARAQPGGGNHAKVQQHGRDGGHGKALPRIQNARRQGHQRHAADVGKHPARHARGGLKTGRIQTAGQQQHQQRRGQHARQAGGRQRPGQRGGHGVNQMPRGLDAIALLAGGQHGHESLAERAFAKQPPQQIGNAKGHVEGVGQAADAKGRGHEPVAQQPRDARGQREQGNGGGGFEQAHAGRAGRKAGAYFAPRSIA